MNALMRYGISPLSTRTFSQTTACTVGIKQERDSAQRMLFWFGTMPDGFNSIPGIKQLDNDVFTSPLSSVAASIIRSLPNAPLPIAPPEDAVSFGFGDRLRGFGTRAHILAAKRFPNVLPIFAQQSVRENFRLGRTAQEVMDDTLWAILECGWNRPWAADADHQKTLDDVKQFLEAGFTMVTCDPSDHVLSEAQVDSALELDHIDWAGLEQKKSALDRLWMTPKDFRELQERHMSLWVEPHWGKNINPEAIIRAMAKYGNAIVHAKNMYRYAREHARRDIAFELSVDETATPTTVEEHLLIQTLCKHLKIELFSLAPRFIGRFNKGVDYVKPEGEGSEAGYSSLEENLHIHSFLASRGGYKLSIHSGSDKFSIYPMIAHYCSGDVHLKTSGTSYLAALQVVAMCKPELFMQIFRKACELYPEARQSYHVDADASLLKEAYLNSLRPEEYPTLVSGYHGRQVLHVAFGQLLTEFGPAIFEVLDVNEACHQDLLSAHMARHLRPFSFEQRD